MLFGVTALLVAVVLVAEEEAEMLVWVRGGSVWIDGAPVRAQTPQGHPGVSDGYAASATARARTTAVARPVRI
jgi:hypothetical protein